MQVAPVITIPVMVILAQLAASYLPDQINNFSMPMQMLSGFSYPVAPLLPAVVALILGHGLLRYTAMGLAQTVIATLMLFVVPFGASYLLAYYIAVYVPFRIVSVADYSNALLSLRPAVEGFCRLVILSACAPTFRMPTAWIAILTCWSGATVLLLFAYWDEMIAVSYPTLVQIATLLGFAVVGYRFPRERATW